MVQFKVKSFYSFWIQFQWINSVTQFSTLIDAGNDFFMLISQRESNILCTYLHNEINLAEVYTGLKKYASVTKAITSEIMWDNSNHVGQTQCLKKDLIGISAKILQLLL